MPPASIIDDEPVEVIENADMPIQLIYKKDGERTGIRFTPINKDDGKKLAREYRLKHIDIVLRQYQLKYGNYRRPNAECLTREYLLADYIEYHFGPEAAKSMMQCLEQMMRSVREIIGIQSVPQMTEMNYYALRQKAKNDLRAFPYDTFVFRSPSGKSLQFDAQEISESYVQSRKYELLLTNCDFAKSFLTSEYLYTVMNAGVNMDYTTVVTGYLKSVEQMLYQILQRYCDSGKKLKTTWRFYHDMGKNAPRKIEMNKENLSADYCKTTLDAMVSFFRNNPDCWTTENRDIQRNAIAVFDEYKDKIRNGYFHKDNLTEWEQVNQTREDTIYLYCLILSLLKWPDEFQQHLIDDLEDDFDRVAAMIEDSMYDIYYLLYENGKSGRIRYDGRFEYPVSDYHAGKRHFEYLKFHRIIRDDKGLFKEGPEYKISRNNMPIGIWAEEKSNTWIPITHDGFGKKVTSQELINLRDKYK